MSERAAVNADCAIVGFGVVVETAQLEHSLAHIRGGLYARYQHYASRDLWEKTYVNLLVAALNAADVAIVRGCDADVATGKLHVTTGNRESGEGEGSDGGEEAHG